MPIGRKRKTYTSSPFTPRKVAKRRAMRKRINRSRVGRNPSTNLHHFKRYTGAFDIQNSATTTEKPYAMVFTFNQLINYSEFETLYDRYRIDYIDVKLQLQTNPDSDHVIGNDAVINETNFYPKLWWIKDYDDSSADTLTELRQRAGAKYRIMKPNSEVKIRVRPAILNQTYRTSTTTGYAPKWRQWIDFAQVDVPHYGLKINLDLNGRANTEQFYILRVETQFHFTCKDVR